MRPRSECRIVQCKFLFTLGYLLTFFQPTLRNAVLRQSWGLKAEDLAILSVGRLSSEKNLSLLIKSFSLLSRDIRSRAVLVFVGDGPLASHLRELCTAKDVRALFLGQLTGEALGRAVASADIMRYCREPHIILPAHDAISVPRRLRRHSGRSHWKLWPPDCLLLDCTRKARSIS